MSQLFESIKIENGRLINIEYHNQRLNNSRRMLFNCKRNINLAHMIKLGEEHQQGLFKCRVRYRKDLTNIEIEPYTKKKIQSLKMVYSNSINYHYKYFDRYAIQQLFEQKKDCDDILIVRNNLITDTSFANIAFYKNREWYSPDQPLLRGTKRQYLIDEGIIQTCSIRADEIMNYEKAVIFNAMLDLESSNEIPISAINS